MSLSDKRVLFYDKGCFIAFAQRLARDFAWVGYYTPGLECAYPHPYDVAIGEGLTEIERVYDFWDEVETADLIVFPDVGNGDLQDYLRKQGKRVWGSGGAQWLELNRIESRQHMHDLGLKIPPTTRVKGVTKLRAYLNEHEDVWVKISLFRGAFETYHHINSFLSKVWLDTLTVELGAQAEHIEFVIEDGVEGVEIGWDSHCIDGQFPELGFYGLEVKDKALIGVMKKFSSLPEKVQNVYTSLSPALNEGKYRNYFSVEMRLNGIRESPCIIDPCCRLGSPCSEGWMELAGNLGEIVYFGAEGTLVQTTPVAPYAVLAVIVSEWATKYWTPIDVPKEIREWVKMKCLTVIDGDYYYVPGDLQQAEIGVVVGIGNSLDEAIEMCEDNAEQIQGYKLDIKTDSLREGQEAMEESESVGIPFKEP